MAGPGLPVNVDTTYADSGTDASVKTHQQHHDLIHTVVNDFDLANAATAGYVPVGNGTVLLARPLVSTDNPGLVTNTTAGTAYTFVAADAGALREFTAATATAATVPANSAVPFAAGTQLLWRAYGAGTVTFTPAAGVTINSRGQIKTSAGAYAEGVLTKRGTDEWILVGDIA